MSLTHYSVSSHNIILLHVECMNLITISFFHPLCYGCHTFWFSYANHSIYCYSLCLRQYIYLKWLKIRKKPLYFFSFFYHFWWFCFSEKVFVLPSFLMDNFVEYRILEWQIFSFSALIMLFYPPPGQNVSDESALLILELQLHKCQTLWYCTIALTCSVLILSLSSLSFSLANFYWPISKFTDFSLSHMQSTDMSVEQMISDIKFLFIVFFFQRGRGVRAEGEG